MTVETPGSGPALGYCSRPEEARYGDRDDWILRCVSRRHHCRLVGSSVTTAARNAELERGRIEPRRALRGEVVENVKILEAVATGASAGIPARAAWDDARRVLDLDNAAQLALRSAYARAATYQAAVLFAPTVMLSAHLDDTARRRTQDNLKTEAGEVRDAFVAALAALVVAGTASEDDRAM